jgi:hypothetical protein
MHMQDPAPDRGNYIYLKHIGYSVMGPAWRINNSHRRIAVYRDLEHMQRELAITVSYSKLG